MFVTPSYNFVNVILCYLNHSVPKKEDSNTISFMQQTSSLALCLYIIAIESSAFILHYMSSLTI